MSEMSEPSSPLDFDPSALRNIVFWAVAMTTFVEVATFLLVYRSKKYQALLQALSSARKARDLADQKAASVPSSQPNKGLLQKQKVAEEQFQNCATLITAANTWPNICQAGCNILLTRWLKRQYSGVVVGVLPFVPWRFFGRLTQIGLDRDAGAIPGNASGFIFIWFLLNISIKAVLKHLIGQESPEGVGMSSFFESPHAKKLMKRYGVGEEEVASMQDILGVGKKKQSTSVAESDDSGSGSERGKGKVLKLKGGNKKKKN